MNTIKWGITAVCLSMLFSSVALAKPPKEVPKKGNPADQAVLNLNAALKTDTFADGNISDWNENTGEKASFQTLLSGEYEYDWTGPNDLSATVMSQYTADRIFFLVQVKDNAVVSKKKQWKSDKVELWLAAEDADGKSLGATRGAVIDLGPQVDGAKAEVKWLTGKKDGIDAYAFISPDGGYDVEIGVDYSAIAKTSPVMNGTIRYCVLVRDWDQDDENEDEASIGSCPINPKKASSIKRDQMGKISLNLRDSLWEQLLKSDKQLRTIEAEWTKIDADVAGTSLPEIIAFAADTLVVAGYAMNGVEGLSWTKALLDSGSTTQPVQLEVKDIEGDKKKEILLSRNEHCLNGAMNADRTYIFRVVNGIIKELGNYITEQRNDDGSPDYIRNQYKFTKAGIVQSGDKTSSPQMLQCSLKALDEENWIISPKDEVQSRTIPYRYVE